MIVINPEILTWARSTAGLGVDLAAKKLNFKDSVVTTASEKLLQYENGKKQPSVSLLSKMSKLYRRPLLTFYLQEPPIKDKGIEDYRTLPSGKAMDCEGLVSALVRDIKSRQSIVRSVLIDEDEDAPIEFIGCCEESSSVEVIAEKIKKYLKFELQDFRDEKNPDEAFRHLRAKAESMGVYVLMIGNLGSHHSNMPVSHFRGFALSDDIAPFIVINNQDSKAAWSFTLLHELAHLSLGQTGISGGFSEQKIEKLCNDIASAILLKDEEVNDLGSDFLNIDDACDKIENFANARNVSRSMVAYRLYRNSFLSKDVWIKINAIFEEKWFRYREDLKRKYRSQEGGPNPYVIRRYNLGSLVGLMERMSSTGAVTATKAGAVLGTKALKVHKLFNAGQTNGTV